MWCIQEITEEYISEIVLVGDLPEALSRDAEMYAGCVAGAIQKEAYLELIGQECIGFWNYTRCSIIPVIL
jgi:hypothetical protein